MVRMSRLLPRSRRAGLLAGAAALALPLSLLGQPTATALPPNIPSPATAQTELDALTVAPEGSMNGYSRDLFPHWSSSDGCTARQSVLIRDGEGVAVDDSCQPTTGSWESHYDGVTLNSASDVDIDHVVPLAEAWRSGADSWTTDRRRAFANDLGGPQLLAVSASSNRSKGDQDPADWGPQSSFECTYSRMYIHAKYFWDLSVDSAEQAALQDMLNTC